MTRIPPRVHFEFVSLSSYYLLYRRYMDRLDLFCTSFVEKTQKKLLYKH